MSQPRVFTRDTLEAIAYQRGEQYPSSPMLGELLLSYMRSEGQLEQNVDRVKAREDFQRLVRHIGYDDAFPKQEKHEFPPFTRMRADVARLRQQHLQQLEHYKSKRDARAREAQPTPPATTTPVKARSKPSELITKLANYGTTALKGVQRGQRDRTD